MEQIFEIIKTPIGNLYCLTEQEKISLLHFDSRLIPSNAQKSSHPLIQECQAQLDAYFKSSLCHFSLPIAIKGNNFTKCTLKALQSTSQGERITYQALAQMAGSPKAYRAIGTILSKNPILIIIPCHRVILSSGKIGEYAWGWERKKYLLDLEKSFKN